MKIVLDNIAFKLQSFGGISVYWDELIKYLRANDNDFICIDNNNENTKNNDLYEKLDLSDMKIVYNNEKVKFSRYLTVKDPIGDPHIFHSSYYRYTKNRKAKVVTTVWDFTYENYSKGLKRFVHHRQKANALKHSDAIICISESTKKDMLHYFPNLKNKKIEVIYCGVSEEYKKLANAKEEASAISVLKDIPQKYIMYVGSRANYKNFDIAVKVIAELSADYCLVVVGSEFNETENSMISDIKDRVVLLKNLTTSQINLVYNNAFCLLYPSSYEGFGIPIVEAMRAGCPTVALNATSIPEVMADGGIMLDSLDVEMFKNAIESLENNIIRQNLIDKGFFQAQKFNWHNSFIQLMKLYEEIGNCDKK